MKTTGKLIIFILTFLALSASASAQSPREQLTQMVAQLQQTPDDTALRERIINLAPTLRPSPALPDSAVVFEGRAQFAFRSATSEGDFLAAAREYEKAVAVAPWVPGYYADLCAIYEKAGKYEDANRNCGFYLIGLTDPSQITDVKRRIAGLEFGIEKANAPQTAQASMPSGPDFSGCWQPDALADTTYCLFSFERDGDGWIVRDSDLKPLGIVRTQGRQIWVDFDFAGYATRHYALILSGDGQTIEATQHDSQSPDQRRRLEAGSPGSSFTSLNVPTYFTMKKRK